MLKEGGSIYISDADMFHRFARIDEDLFVFNNMFYEAFMNTGETYLIEDLTKKEKLKDLWKKSIPNRSENIDILKTYFYYLIINKRILIFLK